MLEVNLSHLNVVYCNILMKIVNVNDNLFHFPCWKHYFTANKLKIHTNVQLRILLPAYYTNDQLSGVVCQGHSGNYILGIYSGLEYNKIGTCTKVYFEQTVMKNKSKKQFLLKHLIETSLYIYNFKMFLYWTTDNNLTKIIYSRH